MAKLKLYRIYTEDVRRDKIEHLLNQYLESFTVYSGRGYWNFQSEASLMIEAVLPSSFDGVIKMLAKRIKATNKQDAVLITSQDVDSELV